MTKEEKKKIMIIKSLNEDAKRKNIKTHNAWLDLVRGES